MEIPPDFDIYAKPKRYFVAKTKVSKYIGICDAAQIAALANANIITEDFVATEHKRPSPSYDKLMNSENTVWVKVSELLAEAYKDQPLVTVVLNDVENKTVILNERYHSKCFPRSVAVHAVLGYFDQHFMEYATASPKEFLVYFKSDKCPASIFNLKIIFKPETHRRGTTDSKYAPFEETYPYTFKDSESHMLELPEEFPSVALDLKPPKYDPTATLPPEFRSPLAT